MTKPDVLLWLDDNRGVYIPRDFAHSFVDRKVSVANVTDEQWAILESGAEYDSNEWYWDTWCEVCDEAIVTDEKGVQYRLYQEGALWLVPIGMEWDDDTEFFKWPDDESDDES